MIFFLRIPELKLKTFSSKVNVRSAKRVEATRKNSLFARMLLPGQSRDVDIKEILTYSLGMFLLSLSTGVRILHKTQKSMLMASS